ncbi:hypothetical protein [Vibrio maerlii]|uniref:hypothetical protein n=1 Tax=Vibrio maerlii TaxID=2231648 RepID=UPI000E3ED7CE|nr:hypothetical protein [Vibrio maerlii]
MKYLALTAALFALSPASFAADSTAEVKGTQCYAGKYDAYIDASLNWYKDLTELTTEQYPELEEVSQWFLQGRINHFELNRAAVHYYLNKDTSKVATEQPVEAWLKLEQSDIKELAQRDDELGKVASTTFQDRQTKPHNQNYELRSAFADLLSHPKQIDKALSRYNDSIAQLEAIDCN